MLRNLLASVGLISIGALAAVGLLGFDENVNNQKQVHLLENPVLVSPPLPREITFCREPVPVERFDVREMLEKQVLANMYSHASTAMIIKRAARWKGTFLRILREEGIPEDFFYLMVAESAIENARSWAGAQGFWQFMKTTAEEYGMEVNDAVDERNDPIRSCYAACAYLKKAFRRFGNWTLVAASYNMGMGGVNLQILRQQQFTYYNLHLNKETANYVFRIVALKIILENPEAYGFRIFPGDLYEPIPTRTVEVDTPITDLVGFARAQGTSYQMLKLMNQWIVGDELPNRTGKRYTLHLPRN
jgi:hypothetical protein